MGGEGCVRDQSLEIHARDDDVRCACVTSKSRSTSKMIVESTAVDSTAAESHAIERPWSTTPVETRSTRPTRRTLARLAAMNLACAVSALAAGGVMAMPPTQPAVETQNKPLSAQKPILRCACVE